MFVSGVPQILESFDFLQHSVVYAQGRRVHQDTRYVLPAHEPMLLKEGIGWAGRTLCVADGVQNVQVTLEGGVIELFNIGYDATLVDILEEYTKRHLSPVGILWLCALNRKYPGLSYDYPNATIANGAFAVFFETQFNCSAVGHLQDGQVWAPFWWFAGKRI